MTEPGPPPPDWLVRLGGAAATGLRDLGRPAPGGSGRPSAVLMLFGHGPDLLFTLRSATLRNHPGQPAFPGGGIDPGDQGPADAALREAAEETGLDRSGVDVVTVLPELYLARTGFRVVPVLGWWRRPSPVRSVDAAEVAAVRRIPVADLADPASRLVARAPGGYSSPAFRAGGMLIWGFTASLVDVLLRSGGWERPWDHSVTADVPVR